MSVIFCDSPHARNGATKFTSYSPSSIQAGVNPDGEDAYRFAASGSPAIFYRFTPVASCMINTRMRSSTLSGDANSTTSDVIAFYGDSGGTRHLTFCLLTDGSVRVRRGTGAGTILGTSAIGLVVANVWFDLEMRVTIADAGGRVQVWINGDSTPVIDFTGDTKNAGTNTTVDQVLWSRANTGNMEVSDLVVRDDTTFVGPLRVATSLPTGAGTHTDLTPSPAVANYLNVDEQTPDGATSFNAGVTEGDIDTYAMGDLPAGTWDVLAVQWTAHVQKSDAGAKFGRPVLRVGGTDYVGASQALPATYAARTEIFNTSPDTATTWTEAEVDALEAGIEVRDS